MLKFLIFLFSFLSKICSTKKVCLNPEGEEVDWYTIFFMPSSISTIGEIDYGYFDPSLSSL